MIDDLFAADTLTAARDAIRNPRPAAPPERKTSVWGAITSPRGVIEAVAQVGASVVDVVGGFGQVAGAYPEALGISPTPEQRRQADEQREKLLRDGVDMSNDLGDSLRAAGRAYRPDPATASTAEQVIYGFARGAAKVVGGAVAAGPAGVLAMGAEEGLSQADDLKQQGVPLEARAKAGAVQGAGLALAALPLLGTTLSRTAALYVAGGPGGFMAQQALTREILRDAGQHTVAEQFDPFDPVGLAVATLLPAGFAAYGIRAQRLRRAYDSLPAEPPRDASAPPAAEPPAAAGEAPPVPRTAVADAVARYPEEVIDAARVRMMVEERARSNPGAAADARVFEAHETALARAEDQIAAGERVEVAGVAPRVVITGAEREANFKAWFGDSKVVDQSGSPLVVYHGTNADFSTFDASKGGQTDSGWYGRGGFHFTPHAGWTFAEDAQANRGGAANVMPVYVSLKNPAYGLADAERGSDLIGSAKERGKDGVILRFDAGHEHAGEIAEIIAFRPEQIKSAIGNSGKFDPNSASLTDPLEDFAAGLRAVAEAAGPLEARTPVAAAVSSDAPSASSKPIAAAPEAEAAAAPARLAEIEQQFPDLQVMLDGMDSPMLLSDFLAAAKAEADEFAADAPLVELAAQCALTNGL